MIRRADGTTQFLRPIAQSCSKDDRGQTRTVITTTQVISEFGVSVRQVSFQNTKDCFQYYLVLSLSSIVYYFTN